MIETRIAVAPPFRRASSRSLASPSPAGAVRGPVPYNWLAPTGRLQQVLTAWSRGDLAEVPTGSAFDVILLPGTAAALVLELARRAWVRTGPVVLGAAGAEVIIRRGSAPNWSVEGTCLRREGALVLLPPPTVLVPAAVASRSWLVPPTHRAANAWSPFAKPW